MHLLFAFVMFFSGFSWFGRFGLGEPYCLYSSDTPRVVVGCSQFHTGYTGYGTYTWKVYSKGLRNLDSVFGMFTWSDSTPGNSEIDIEVANWDSEVAVWLTVQPDFQRRVALPKSKVIVFSFEWLPRRVAFKVNSTRVVCNCSAAMGSDVVAAMNMWGGDGRVKIKSFDYTPATQ
jgi:hypothetical protein